MPHEPLTQRGRLSRDRIVEAAAALVADRGVEGASLDQILAVAGASKSQLYHYFSGKDDLIRAVITSREQQALGAQMPLLAKLDTWAAIRGWFDMMISQNAAHGCPGCPIGTLASELAGRDELARADLASCFATWSGYLIEGLERMRRRGDLRPSADPQQLATAVFASMQGGLLLSKTQKDPEPLRVALDAAFTHLRSFRASRRRSSTAERSR